MLRPSTCWIVCRTKVSRAASSWTSKYRRGRPGPADAATRTRLDIADHIPHGLSDIPTAVQAVKAGADAFMTKPVTSEKLLRAIERAFARHQTSRDLQHKLDVLPARIGTLTTRQRQVFELVIRGKTNKEAARALGGIERTIKAHRQRAMAKMHVQSIVELVSLAERAGVLDSASSSRQIA